MALIIETGAGVLNANSYVTDAEATAYLTTRGQANQWTGIGSQSDREAKLVQGFDFLNGLRWKSEAYDVDQAGAFPRLAYDGVPKRIKSAQIMLALQAVSGPLVPTTISASVIKERKKLDGVGETEIEYADPISNVPIYAFLDGLIGEYLATVPGSGIQIARRLVG